MEIYIYHDAVPDDVVKQIRTQSNLQVRAQTNHSDNRIPVIVQEYFLKLLHYMNLNVSINYFYSHRVRSLVDLGCLWDMVIKTG